MGREQWRAGVRLACPVYPEDRRSGLTQQFFGYLSWVAAAVADLSRRERRKLKEGALALTVAEFLQSVLRDAAVRFAVE